MSVVINGSAGVTTNSGAVYNGISAGTAIASTSGTSIDFTSIPSWVKRITVMFSGVSTNGTSIVQVQIGSGSLTTTGYVSAAQNSGSGNTSTTGFAVTSTVSASNSMSGALVLFLVTGTTWVSSGSILQIAAGSVAACGGVLALGGTLDRVRITTVNGTDTFDAGSINILYE